VPVSAAVTIRRQRDHGGGDIGRFLQRAEFLKTLVSVNNMVFLLNNQGRFVEAAEVRQVRERAARRTWSDADPGSLGNDLAKLGEAEFGMRNYADTEITLL